MILLATSTFLTLVPIFHQKYKKYFFAGYIILFIISNIFFITAIPSNNLDWKDNVKILPYAKIDGDNIKIYNIRNFNYKSTTDYKIQYYNETFNLQKLDGVDLIAVYWMGPSIAHIFLSFSFSDSKRLAISIETRNEKNEEYSTIKGFFKQYELFYVVADERDVVRLRTDFRDNPKEDVYIYKLKGTIKSGQKLFLDYINKINSLKINPAFYNTIATNCTTSIWSNSSIVQNNLSFSWKIIASGYLPKYLYDNGKIEDYGLTFKELQDYSYANNLAKKVNKNDDFSLFIRDK